ncbi:MAG TPA: DUF3300 domain-containing protein [Steroidobacteraceae bacterium]|nr:DUF3300 domain-containing protein [Steroidobacteraceae bacterium]
MNLFVPTGILGVLFAIAPAALLAQDAPPPAQTGPPGAAAAAYTQESPAQLQQLVAPIALYPDRLVAQILAASTFPEEIVEADRWVQANPDLKDQARGQAVDQQPWDPSVKALTAFPTVLGNMDKNLSWTSSLGDAYYNQQQELMDAVQVMRQRAQQAGNLKSTPQQAVSDQNSTISIEPVTTDVVYVPAYNPWMVYGDLVPIWPQWYEYPGVFYGGPYLSFGVGFGIGFVGDYGWGWPNWGFDWGRHAVLFNHSRYVSHSVTFYNRNNFYRAGGGRGGAIDHRGAVGRPFEGNPGAARGYAEPHGQSGTRSGAFSGFDHGGQARGLAERGRASVGGGGSRAGGGERAGAAGGSRGGGGSREHH